MPASADRNVADDERVVRRRRRRRMQSALQGDRAVLQADTTFSAPPYMQALHGYFFVALAAFSALGFHEQLKSGLTNPWSWTFVPLMLYCSLSICYHAYCIVIRKRCVHMQLGPEPDPSITVAAATMQWRILHRCFVRQHVAASAADISLLVGILSSEAILYNRLVQGDSITWKIVALPLAIVGFISVAIHTLFRLRRRACIPTVSTRAEFLVIFAYIAAYKLDENTSLPWGVGFILAFWWVSGFICMGLGLLGVLYIGRRSALFTPPEFMTRLGIVVVHVSYVFLLVAFVLLERFFAGPHKLTRNDAASKLQIAAIMVITWLGGLAVGHALTAKGQTAREAVRRAQMEAGRVWTRTATLGHGYGATVVQQQVDIMSDEELAHKAREMMSDYDLPPRLYRIDTNLWSVTPKPQQKTEHVGAVAPYPDPPASTANATAPAQPDLSLGTTLAWPLAGVVPALFGQAGSSQPAQHAFANGAVPSSGHSAATAQHADAEAKSPDDAQQQVAVAIGPAPHGGAGAHVTISVPHGDDTEKGTTADASAECLHQRHDSASDGDAEERLCCICFEGQPEFVLMPCGHGGFCQVCAHRIFVKPPHHCSNCRRVVAGVLRVPLNTAVGESALISLPVD